MIKVTYDLIVCNHKFAFLRYSSIVYSRIEMDSNSDHVENFKNIAEEVKTVKEVTDLGIEVKIENPDGEINFKTESSEEQNDSEPIQVIGEKWKNNEKSNLEIENKKIKEEFVVFEELDHKIELQDKPESQNIREINLDDLDNQVI